MKTMITDEQAHDFANDWIHAWNTHDLDRVLSLLTRLKVL